MEKSTKLKTLPNLQFHEHRDFETHQSIDILHVTTAAEKLACTQNWGESLVVWCSHSGRYSEVGIADFRRSSCGLFEGEPSDVLRG